MLKWILYKRIVVWDAHWQDSIVPLGMIREFGFEPRTGLLAKWIRRKFNVQT